jgi:hypothetical protein
LSFPCRAPRLEVNWQAGALTAMKTSTSSLAIIAALILSSTIALAQTPQMSFGTRAVGNIKISFDVCQRRAAEALRDEGYEVNPAKDVVVGKRGEFVAQIICAPRQVIVFVVMGPNSPETARNVDTLANNLAASRK